MMVLGKYLMAEYLDPLGKVSVFGIVIVVLGRYLTFSHWPLGVTKHAITL